MTSRPATIELIAEAVFDALGDEGERDGFRWIVPSGYGSGPLILNVRNIAVELAKTFDILEREAPAHGN
jgi:hypothetical protein